MYFVLGYCAMFYGDANSKQYKIYGIKCTVYNTRYIMHSIQYTVYNTYYTIPIKYTLYNTQYTINVTQ